MGQDSAPDEVANGVTVKYTWQDPARPDMQSRLTRTNLNVILENTDQISCFTKMREVLEGVPLHLKPLCKAG